MTVTCSTGSRKYMRVISDSCLRLVSCRLAGWCVLLLGVLSLGGCRSDEGAGDTPALPRMSVVLVTSTGGGGDNGYNDLILSGVMDFYRDNEDEVSFSLRHPANMDEAGAIVSQWLERTSGFEGNSILLLASGDYRKMVEEMHPELTGGQTILLFECPHEGLPKGVSTFRIGRYGASCLAGMMAGESPEAHVVAACPGDDILEDAVRGFSDGYRAASGREAEVHYLAEDASGYSMPGEAYRIAQGFDEAFVFPLAGGSNSGIFKFSREYAFSLQLIAGMDVDCADYSTRVPFSLVVHIDRLVRNLLDGWKTDGRLPEHSDYRLADKEAIEIVTNPLFLKRVDIFRDYYADNDYWDRRLDRFLDVALEKERVYYGK